jgi:hypothetical protein
VKRFLQEHAKLPMNCFSKENIQRRFRTTLKDRYGDAPLDTLIPIVQRAENIIVAVIGGAGKHSAWLPTFGETKAVTRVLTRREGQPVRSLQELKQFV